MIANACAQGTAAVGSASLKYRRACAQQPTSIIPGDCGPNLRRSTRVLHLQGRVITLNPWRLAHLLPVHDAHNGFE